MGKGAYVFPFFSLRNMPDLSPKGIDLGVKPSAPSCPLTLPPYLEIQTEIQSLVRELSSQKQHGGPRGAIPHSRSEGAAVRRYPLSKVRSSSYALLEQP